MVAEKPSIASSLAEALAQTGYTSRKSVYLFLKWIIIIYF